MSSKVKYTNELLTIIQQEYLKLGSWNQLIQKYKISPTTINKLLKTKKLYTVESRFLDRFNWIEIQRDYDSGLSIRDICKKYKISKYPLEKGKKEGLFKTRDLKQSSKIREKFKRKTMPESAKKKLSEIMKFRHSQGEAHTLGHNRNKQIPSYPERFMTKIIHNEFFDKNYISEFRFHRFSLDFAWPHLKKCIEIDGQQHE